MAVSVGSAGRNHHFFVTQHSPKELPMCIDIYDEVGIGGGASGMAGGLLHPYSHKECWSESLKLLVIAEATLASKELDSETPDLTETSNRFICRRRGILRPAISLKHLNILTDNAQKSLPCCKIESLDRDAAQSLVASLCVPLNLAFYMPEAINVHPQRYRKVLEDGKLTLKTQTTKPPQPSVFVSWSPDNTMLRTCGNVEVLKLWDVESGTIDMDLITTGVSASERMRRENLLSATRNVIMEKLQIGGPSLGLVEVH